MGRTAGRATDDTRRMILDAAMTLVARRGAGASVADMAKAAGVSKGGLLYHFPTKDDLLRAGAIDLFESFRTRVYEAAQPEPEGVPGRLTRAYIRISFADAAGDSVREVIAVAAQLMAEKLIQEMSDADGRRWRDELMADGLADSTVRLIIAATDGVSSAPLWGTVLDEADQRALEQELLAMTRP